MSASSSSRRELLLADLEDLEGGLPGVCDNGEALVSVRGDPILLLDESRSEIASRSERFCYVRRGVLERLREAGLRLPEGLSLLVKEGYRPPGRQRTSYDNVYRRYASLHPALSPAELRRLVSQYVAPIEVAGHPTGGAVDLTLARKGRELFLGTRFNDEPEETGGRTWFAASGIGAEARECRDILAACLEPAGFVNYPPEWWHWSYGDRYWAAILGREAVYGPIEEDSDSFS